MLPTPTISPLTLPEQFNAAPAFLDRHLTEGRGGKIAIYCEGKSFTYAQIAELANRVGNGLLELGVNLEQRVALLSSEGFSRTCSNGLLEDCIESAVPAEPEQTRERW
jgi:acyl-CoA synthetase (AMP-forming)/AMP-acid ligase II